MESAYPKPAAFPTHVLEGRAASQMLSNERFVIFTLPSTNADLVRAIQVFSEVGVAIVHIETRPSGRTGGFWDVFVSTESPQATIDTAITALRAIGFHVTNMDTKQNLEDPLWFPRSINDLDLFVHRVLDAGRDLKSDHPGFTDETYRKRRQYFADIALAYRHGQEIPRVKYTPEEIATWGVIFRELTKLYPTHACNEFNEVFPLLVEHCGYRDDNIPQLQDISDFLHRRTGFRVRPVAGLLSSRDFLAGLAFRVFHSTQYIRHQSQPLYTPEPDVCHEILGHVPLFADKSFAEFSQQIGLASLGASDEDITRLATCYWFTVEFGLCRQQDTLKAFGAGLLSSFGELQYCLTDKPQLKPFDPAITAAQEYPITEYQPVYFVADSFESAKEKMARFAASLVKPFSVYYDPYTETVQVLDSAVKMKELADSIQGQLSELCRGLDKRV